jgi:hypothetical protein
MTSRLNVAVIVALLAVCAVLVWVEARVLTGYAAHVPTVATPSAVVTPSAAYTPRPPDPTTSRMWERVDLDVKPIPPTTSSPVVVAQPSAPRDTEAAGSASTPTSPSDQRRPEATRRPVVSLGKTATGPNVARDYARTLIDAAQFSCLDPLWEHESHWNPAADNPTSSAYGVAQLLTERSHDPRVQVRDGLSYIAARYSTPCDAWAAWQRKRWY